MTHTHHVSGFSLFPSIDCRFLNLKFYYLSVVKTQSLLTIKYHATLSTRTVNLELLPSIKDILKNASNEL